MFIVFNRLDTIIQTFEVIKSIKPNKLYIAADAYRQKYPEEAKACEEVKNYILHNINWNCKVYTLFPEKNYGSIKISVSTAITWFFEHEEFGIILEHDCIPDKSFFYFCGFLLEKYKNNKEIMHINGTCFNDVFPNRNYYYKKLISSTNNFYFFSLYTHIWGWASWRRAWNYYKAEFSPLPLDKLNNKKLITHIQHNPKISLHWNNLFNETASNKIDTWDYQWQFCIWQQNGICITPTKNLVKNIGFGKLATNTKNKNHPFANLKTYNLSLPTYQICEKEIKVNYLYDVLFFKYFLTKNSFIFLVVRKLLGNKFALWLLKRN